MNSQAEKLSSALACYIRPLTYPIAFKFLKNEPFPMTVRRPVSFGNGLTLCQGYSIVRKYGWVLGFEMEDCTCAPQLSYFGAIPYTEKQRKGGIIYPIYTKTPEGGQNCEALLPRLPEGMYDRIILAPLNKADFEPDLFIIYVNPGQAARLIQGAVYCNGEPIATLSAGRGACVSETVVPYLAKGYSCTIPGGGEKMFALTGDEEMVFSLHASKIDELVEGLSATHKIGIGRYPWPIAGVKARANMPESYRFLEELAAAKYSNACKAGNPTEKIAAAGGKNKI